MFVLSEEDLFAPKVEKSVFGAVVERFQTGEESYRTNVHFPAEKFVNDPA
jgi:hypothetical protein